MDNEDALFEDIRALCDEAYEMGLEDVALVLEFALDVFLKDFLKETGATGVPQATDAVARLERSARALDVRREKAPQLVPRIGWSMSSFPLADMMRRAS